MVLASFARLQHLCSWLLSVFCCFDQNKKKGFSSHSDKGRSQQTIDRRHSSLLYAFFSCPDHPCGCTSNKKQPYLRLVFFPFSHETGIVANEKAGPAVVISFIIASIVAGLAALSYAEMACLVPIAGSAYTYTYATCGELMAWIIGWDL